MQTLATNTTLMLHKCTKRVPALTRLNSSIDRQALEGYHETSIGGTDAKVTESDSL